MRTHAITATALLLAVTACTSASNSDDKPAATKKAAKATKPEPSATPDKPRAFGETLTFTGEEGTKFAVTVLGYEQGTFKPQTSADAEFNTTGYTWAALELKACLKKGTSGVTRYPWALAYADGTRIEPSTVTYDDFPKPEYPYEAKMKAGDCVRGKTVFAVPAKQRPERVLYTTDSFDTPPEWAVPKP